MSLQKQSFFLFEELECIWNSCKRKQNDTKITLGGPEYKFCIPFTLSTEQPAQKSAVSLTVVLVTRQIFKKHQFPEASLRRFVGFFFFANSPSSLTSHNVTECVLGRAWQKSFFFLKCSLFISVSPVLCIHTQVCVQCILEFSSVRGHLRSAASLPATWISPAVQSLCKSSCISVTLGGSLPLTLTVFPGNPEHLLFRKVKKTYCAG